MKTVIVPGVGGSDAAHWQSWLELQLNDTVRVEQQWNLPVLSTWVAQFKQVLDTVDHPVQIVAHSFGCLTSVAALAQYPALAASVQSLVLVAPANPERFSIHGLRQHGEASIATLLPQAALPVPACLIASRNDPWLEFGSAQQLAAQWQAQFIDLGLAGHINVASGFGAWPALLDYTAALQAAQHDKPHLSPAHRQHMSILPTSMCCVAATPYLVFS